MKSRSVPRNNVMIVNNSTVTHKDVAAATAGGKSERSGGHSPEDSALGTLSTGAATLTDKSSATDKYQYVAEGTSSCLIEDSTLMPADGVEAGDVAPVNGVINNNAVGELKVRSNPNLLALPGQHGMKNGKSLDAAALRFAEDGDDVTGNRPCKASKKGKKSGLQLDKAYSVDHIIEPDDGKPSSGEMKRRCSSLAFVNVTNLFRRSSNNFKSNQKCAKPPGGSQMVAAQPGKMTAKDKKILKMILVIFLSFVICYLPITISKAYTPVDSKVFNIMGYILIYLTPCINPLIYVVMSSEYRQAYKNLLMCRAYGSEGSGRST